MENYILTLDFIKQECEETEAAWNGDEAGIMEDRAHAAHDALELIAQLEELLKELDMI